MSDRPCAGFDSANHLLQRSENAMMTGAGLARKVGTDAIVSLRTRLRGKRIMLQHTLWMAVCARTDKRARNAQATETR
jgi:hypothetical protein